MRAMEIIPAASLDAGKEQANRSADACSEGRLAAPLRAEWGKSIGRASFDTRTLGPIQAIL
jgi:hypothetical protein